MANDHYFSADPSSVSAEKTISCTVLGRRFAFLTDHGVFSKDEADRGSLVLLEHLEGVLREAPALRSGDYLDFACGYGLIGIVLKKRFPPLRLHMCDLNARATALAEKNLVLNGIGRGEIRTGDGLTVYPADRRFDLITLNPPIRSGKDNVKRLLNEAVGALRKDGALVTVIGKKQGAESYERFFEENYPGATRIGKDKGFYVHLIRRS